MKINKIYILGVFIGIICKIYDDLSDNNLYSQFGITDKNKPYVDDILKGMFIIGHTILSIEYPLYYVIFTGICLAAYLHVSEDFTSYDFSCFISPIVAIPFLKWSKVNEYYKNAAFTASFVFTVYLFELFHSGKKEENRDHNYKKLYTRTICAIASIIALKYRSIFYIPDDLIGILLFCIGYCGMSAIFQFCFLNGILKPGSLDTDNDEENDEGNNIEKNDEGNNIEKK